jgi:GDP-4-dehydro-6-deoxy-D-mannose reductase
VAALAEGASSLPVGTLTTRRDFTDVRDVVRAYRLLVEHGEPGSLYNVCSGHDVAIGEIADRLLSLADATLTLETDPALVRPVDLPVLRGDPGRLERATGWKPTIALDDTIADVLAYWRAELAR